MLPLRKPRMANVSLIAIFNAKCIKDPLTPPTRQVIEWQKAVNMLEDKVARMTHIDIEAV